MDLPQMPRQRARSTPHQLYLDTLQRPTPDQARRITEVQKQKEVEIQRKYHDASAEEHAAATKIQAAFRGHRERRQLEGHTLDPNQRWVEAIREMRYRAMSAPRRPNFNEIFAGSRDSLDRARENWARAGEIARHAGGSPEPSRPQTSNETASPSISRKDKGMLLDSRYFLEMTDLKHRYGANLQAYHAEWLRSKTDQAFFYWLDHGDGKDISVPGCTREKLDKERVRYLSREERMDYLVRVDEDGKLRWDRTDELITTSADEYKDSMHGIVHKGDSSFPAYDDSPVKQKIEEDINFAERLAAIAQLRAEAKLDDFASSSSSPSSSSSSSESNDGKEAAEQNAAFTVDKQNKKHRKRVFVSPATMLNNLLRATVKPGTWIYVMDTVGRLYVGIKASGAFQHASFLSGARIASAGSIRIENGQLAYLAPLSGHYRPTTSSFRAFVRSLKAQNVDVSKLHVSGSYSILLAMEFYGNTTGGLKKLGKHEKKSKKRDTIGRPESPTKDEQVINTLHEQSALDAVDIVNAAYERKHSKHGLSRLMADLALKKEAKKAQNSG